MILVNYKLSHSHLLYNNASKQKIIYFLTLFIHLNLIIHNINLIIKYNKIIFLYFSWNHFFIIF